MKRTLSLALCLILVASFAGVALAKDSTGRTVARDYSDYHFAADGAQNVLTSSSTGVRFKNTAGTDTFCLYGGPGSSDGKFDNGNGVTPGVLGHSPHNIIPNEWFGVDLTDQPTFWQVASSDGSGSTACFENLDGNGSSGGSGDGPGNQAWWAGQSAAQQPGWATAPGYGNSWNAQLEWRQTISNPGTTAQTVGLTFAFNHDSEPAYDFFNVEYDSATTVKNVYSVDGSNAPFAAPGVQYPAGGAQAITYDAGAYAGPNQDEIVIRMVMSSDGAWSDEDGLFPTTCGGAIVDDITVTYDDGNKATQVDFSDVDNTNSWGNVKAPFVGDFSQIHARLTDIDPCAENFTPVVGFMDDGSCPKNEDNNGGANPCTSTGGSISVLGGWTYGIPGGWVTNYTGGLTFGLLDLTNEVWSPEIAWDLPGTFDNDPEIAGSFHRFTVWRHLPLLNGMFYIWNVRASDDGGATWSPPSNRNFVYFSATGNWLNTQNVVTDLINGPFNGNRPELVQLQLGVNDLAALFAFPGNDATPSPAFDNAGFFKYRLNGPVWATRNIDLMMQAFPQSGQATFATLADRQAAGCRIDMRDISSGSQNFAGDSTIVDVVSAIPGSPLTGPPTMEWIMDRNPLFDDARVVPAGTTVIPGGALNGWDQLRGSVTGEQVVVNGTPVNNGARYYADLYDGQPVSIGGTGTPTFAFPGDVIRWYWKASDTGGRTTTLPANIDGFDNGRGTNNVRYAANFTLRMLPTAVDDGNGGITQPWILFVNDFGFRGGMNDYWQAFDQNGWTEGVHWDMFTTWGPSSSVSNGIGSQGAHGATSAQLAGYQVVVYVSGDLGTTLISDGTNTGNNDKGDDMSTLSGWFNQDDDRYIAHFGDDVLSATLTDSPGPGGTYAATIMGATLGDNIVKDEIQNQSAPTVAPAAGSPWFTTEFVAFGGCAGPNEFDSIDAGAGAVRSHEFLNLAGTPYGGPFRAASVTFSQLDGNLNEKVSITFPYGFVYVWDKAEPEATQVSARARLLKEVIEDCFGHAIVNPDTPTGIGDNTPQYTTFNAKTLRSAPNPFNPKTTISFENAQRQDIEVAIYNIRGEKVMTLHRGVMDAGVQSLTWNGVDDNGTPVASGVYLVKGKALAEGKSFTQKWTLLK